MLMLIQWCVCIYKILNSAYCVIWHYCIEVVVQLHNYIIHIIYHLYFLNYSEHTCTFFFFYFWLDANCISLSLYLYCAQWQ